MVCLNAEPELFNTEELRKKAEVDQSTLNNLFNKVAIPIYQERLTSKQQAAIKEITDLKDRINCMERDKKEHINRLNKLDSYIKDIEEQLKNIKSKTSNI